MAHTEPRAVSVSVLKGGFAKTTTAINLARELAHRNERALVVDLDDNGHMTLNLGFEQEYAIPEDGDDFENENHYEAILIDDADPRESIVNVAGGLDLLPAHQALEDVSDDLKNATMGTTYVKKKIVEPLLGEEYDYIVIDCPANRGTLNDKAMYATQNLIIPLRPENGFESGLTNTVKRLVMDAREHFPLDILAVVPSDLRERIDQDTRDRELLEELHSRDVIRKHIPNFAHLSDDEWDAIDTGKYSGPLPGIRYRGAIDGAHTAGMPLRDYDDSCDQLDCYDELAQIVERGEVDR